MSHPEPEGPTLRSVLIYEAMLADGMSEAEAIAATNELLEELEQALYERPIEIVEDPQGRI